MFLVVFFNLFFQASDSYLPFRWFFQYFFNIVLFIELVILWNLLKQFLDMYPEIEYVYIHACMSFGWSYKWRSPICLHIQKDHVLDIKDPGVHVRVRWIMETPKYPVMQWKVSSLQNVGVWHYIKDEEDDTYLYTIYMQQWQWDPANCKLGVMEQWGWLHNKQQKRQQP